MGEVTQLGGGAAGPVTRASHTRARRVEDLVHARPQSGISLARCLLLRFPLKWNVHLQKVVLMAGVDEESRISLYFYELLSRFELLTFSALQATRESPFGNQTGYAFGAQPAHLMSSLLSIRQKVLLLMMIGV